MGELSTCSYKETREYYIQWRKKDIVALASVLVRYWLNDDEFNHEEAYGLCVLAGVMPVLFFPDAENDQDKILTKDAAVYANLYYRDTLRDFTIMRKADIIKSIEQLFGIDAFLIYNSEFKNNIVKI